MASLSPVARLVRIVTLPETRGLIVAATRSDTLRDLGHRAVHDRAALVRELRDPANARALVRGAARHPATRELASAGLMFLPVRYLPVGWAATWVAHRVLRRHVDKPIEVLGAPEPGGVTLDGAPGEMKGCHDASGDGHHTRPASRVKVARPGDEHRPLTEPMTEASVVRDGNEGDGDG